MPSLQELQARLRTTTDPVARGVLEQLILRLKHRKSPEPREILDDLISKVVAATTEGRRPNRGRIDQALSTYLNEIRRYIENQGLISRQESRRKLIRKLISQATPIQLEGLIGLPFDSRGWLKPRPEMPPNLSDDNPTVAEVFAHISRLVHVDGTTGENTRNKPEDVVAEYLERTRPARAPGVLGLTRQTFARVRRTVIRAIRETFDDVRQWLRDFIRRPLGLTQRTPDQTSYPEIVGGDASQVVLEQKGRGEDDVRQLLKGPTLVGYTLHSAHADNSRPAHVLRDGWRFYSDDRDGSSLPWDQRIIPPYYFENEAANEGYGEGGNCLCFTIEILEDPEGAEYSAQFGLRNSGGVLVTPRDVGTLRTWFNRQRPSVKSRVVGEDRFAALGDRRARLEDFYNLKGDLMSAAELDAEDPNRRLTRRDRVAAIMKAQERRHLAAWEQWDHNDRFDLDPVREQRYLRRLRALFKNL